jgi:zinc transporter 2
MNEVETGLQNEDEVLLVPEHKDENYIKYRKQLTEVNNKVIKKLTKVTFYCIIFMSIQFIGGWLSNSLAIMTDAAHLLSDLLGFIISIVSLYIALRPANLRLTYGYHRAEVIGALCSILIIWVLTIWLVVEAVERFHNPEKIDGLIMISIASCGLLFNLIMSRVLTSEDLPHRLLEHHHDHNHSHSHSHSHSRSHCLDHSHDHSDSHHFQPHSNNCNNEHPQVSNNLHDHCKQKINDTEVKLPSLDLTENPILRAAFIHILGDILQSAGVLIASLIIYHHQEDNPNIVIVDPICSFIFAIIVLTTSVPVSKDCLNVLMEASPTNIDSYSLIKEITKINGVINVHDVHVWCISIGKPSISLHMLSNTPQKSLEEATNLCKKYSIFHSTIQVEDNADRKRESFIQCTHTYDNIIH